MTDGDHAFTAADLRYIRERYRTLEQLCARRQADPDAVRELIRAGRLPQPTYVLPPGVAMFPPDYFVLCDEAGDVDGLPEHFRNRYLAAARVVSQTPEADAAEDWAGYLSGLFGVCLWSVTPESMVTKNRLTRAIDGLLAAPNRGDPAWGDGLRTAVDELDSIERPFTDHDVQRWGDTGRNRYITRVRTEYAEVFAGARPGVP